jgi:hypothetical protein
MPLFGFSFAHFEVWSENITELSVIRAMWNFASRDGDLLEVGRTHRAHKWPQSIDKHRLIV